MSEKTVVSTKTNLAVVVGTYGSKSSSGSIPYSFDYNKNGNKITRITITNTFSKSGGENNKRLYFYDGGVQLGYVTGTMYDNTRTFTFSETSYPEIFRGLVAMIEAGRRTITHKEPVVRGWHTSSSGTKYSYDYLRITQSTITVYYEAQAFVEYGVNGAWKQCEVYYGEDGQWVRAEPKYGTGGEWK